MVSKSDKYSLGMGENGELADAASVYEAEIKTRQTVIDTAVEMAELTIPSVFPPDGYIVGSTLKGNNQSIGARCVNNLASKLMFVAFPPGHPMLKYEAVEHKLRREIERDPNMWAKIELALSRLEIEHRKRLMTTTLTSTYTEAAKQLLVAGNVLWRHGELDKPCFHTMHQYIVKRDNAGHPLLVILVETVYVNSLDEDVAALAMKLNPELENEPEWARVVDIYTVQKLHADGDTMVWCSWQELSGEEGAETIPGTEQEDDYAVPPLFPAWMIPVYGQDWGRSYCEEYRGDLFTVEMQHSALNDGAAAASLTLTFVKPGSRTSVKQIKEAENLSVLAGTAEDLSMFRTEKQNDFQFVFNTAQEAGKRLAYAFLLNSAIQRSGERVTREEIVRMAQDLEMAMGGIYTQLSQTFQNTVVRRFVALHEEEDQELPVPPDGIIRLGLITGTDALGKTVDEQALVEIAGTGAEVLGPAFLRYIRPGGFLQRLSAAKSIQPEGIFKTDEEVAGEMEAEKKQMMQQELLSKAAGPVAGAVAKGGMDQLPAMIQQQQQQQQGQQ